MARRKNPGIGDVSAEADMLNEAADKKLAAAEKMSRANLLLKGADEDAEDEETTARERRAMKQDEDAQAELESERVPIPLSRFEQSLADLGGAGRIDVYKISSIGKRIKVASFAVTDYPERMERIAEEQGGGTFNLMVRDDHGQYVVSTTEDYDTTTYGAARKAAAQNSGNDQVPALDRLMERMDTRDQEHRREMETMRQENQRLMLAMIEKATAPRQETSLIDAIKLVKELKGEERSPMESFREVLELAQSVKEETGLAEPEHPMVAAIDKIMKVASPFMTAWASKLAVTVPPSGKPAVKALPASTGKPDAQVVIPAATEAEAPVVEAPKPVAEVPVVVDSKIAEYANSLFMQADAGVGYDMVGDAIMNLTPDASLDDLYTMASDPSFVASIIAAKPEAVKHEKWLASLAAYIKAEMDKAESEADTPTVEAAPAEAAL